MVTDMTTSQLVRDYNEEVEDVIYKNVPFIETEILTSLMDYIDRISVLRLEFCNLTADQIEIIAGLLLLDNNLITEVSVNGNPNDAQNFNLLLHGTKLIVLSLKYCSIDNIGIEKIANELYEPFENCLLHLNLASNSIRNSGVKHVASFLRINRTLISLNLADNKISDIGCLELMELLQMFPLNFEEIVVRRRIKFDIERSYMEATLLNQMPEGNKSKISLSDALGHPFMWDTFDENQELQCQGNDVLSNLNLSYNRIKYPGISGIIQMLYYQTKNYLQDKGISRISIEGNDFKSCEELLTKLAELLELKQKSSSFDNKRKSHINIRKKSNVYL